MPDQKFRVFATCDIGDAAFQRLRELGYELEVYPGPEAPPKSLVLDQVRSGIDGLITTFRSLLFLVDLKSLRRDDRAGVRIVIVVDS